MLLHSGLVYPLGNFQAPSPSTLCIEQLIVLCFLLETHVWPPQLALFHSSSRWTVTYQNTIPHGVVNELLRYWWWSSYLFSWREEAYLVELWAESQNWSSTNVHCTKDWFYGTTSKLEEPRQVSKLNLFWVGEAIVILKVTWWREGKLKDSLERSRNQGNSEW